MIKRVGFLLVNPQLPENIGFCARALKNFGFKKLDIINPKEKWPNKKAIATSVGARDILNKTKIYSSLKIASNKYDIIYASTAKKRDINKKHLSFKQFIESLTEPVTPKQMDVVKSDTRFIRTPDVIKKENQKFRSKYPFPSSFLPLAKKNYTGKINSDVLKAHPELNPDKPSDYIKLKRLSAKVKKA